MGCELQVGSSRVVGGASARLSDWFHFKPLFRYFHVVNGYPVVLIVVYSINSSSSTSSSSTINSSSSIMIVSSSISKGVGVVGVQ